MFKEYSRVYLKTDVLLLADVFENFRTTCLTIYDYDTSNNLSSPGMVWGAICLTTGVKLGLITDLHMLGMAEKEKRGGLCFVGSKRYVKSNSIYLPEYDPSKPSNYILYADANNMYAWAMMQLLPI